MKLSREIFDLCIRIEFWMCTQIPDWTNNLYTNISAAYRPLQSKIWEYRIESTDLDVDRNYLQKHRHKLAISLQSIYSRRRSVKSNRWSIHMCDTCGPMQGSLTTFQSQFYQIDSMHKYFKEYEQTNAIHCISFHHSVWIPAILREVSYCLLYGLRFVRAKRYCHLLLASVKTPNVTENRFERRWRFQLRRRSRFARLKTIACLISSTSIHTVLIERAITFTLQPKKNSFVNYVNRSWFSRRK